VSEYPRNAALKPEKLSLTRLRDVRGIADVRGLGGLRIPVKRFRGGCVFKAHRRLYHSTLGLREIKKKKRLRKPASGSQVWRLVSGMGVFGSGDTAFADGNV